MTKHLINSFLLLQNNKYIYEKASDRVTSLHAFEWLIRLTRPSWDQGTTTITVCLDQESGRLMGRGWGSRGINYRPIKLLTVPNKGAWISRVEVAYIFHKLPMDFCKCCYPCSDQESRPVRLCLFRSTVDEMSTTVSTIARTKSGCISYPFISSSP